MYKKPSHKKKYIIGSIILVLYFNYEIKSLFFPPTIEEKIAINGILESNFKKSVIMKTIPEIVENIGEPKNFQVRDKFFVLDYFDTVIIENKKNLEEDKPRRYSLVRLLIHKGKNMPLIQNGIFFHKN